jgi:hypothetical protein
LVPGSSPGGPTTFKTPVRDVGGFFVFYLLMAFEGYGSTVMIAPVKELLYW